MTQLHRLVLNGCDQAYPSEEAEKWGCAGGFPPQLSCAAA
jgi:hypothetical protein